MDGVLGEVELAALPSRAAEHGPAGGAQAGVVVGDDIVHPAHAARLQALQKSPPMHLRLGEGDRDPEHPAALVRADADRREHGGVAHDAAVAHLLVARVEDQVSDLAEGPGAPGLQLVVEQLRRAADLRGREALETELAHHRLDLAGRHAFDVHLRDRQHHGAHRPAAALKRLGVERRAIMAGGLGNVDGDRACRRVDALGLVAVGIALALGGALVGASAQEPLPLDLHGKLERAAKDRGDVAGAMLDQMFQERLDRRILLSVHSRFFMGGFATPWNIRMGRPCRGMPRQGRAAPAQAEFPDVRLRYRNPREFEQTDKESQEIAESCNRLIKNAIVCWNYLYFEHRLRTIADPVERQALLGTIGRHAMISWRHVNMLGEYDFSDERLKDSFGLRPTTPPA